MPAQYFSTRQVATFLNHHYRTVRKWILDGRIRGTFNRYGHYRVSADDLRAYAKLPRDFVFQMQSEDDE